MKKQFAQLVLAALTVVAAPGSSGTALAQVAGGAPNVDTHASEPTRIPMRWSVKKSLLGKTIYNDLGKKVGSVDDLIISPDKDVSFVIVGAGGFVGIGRHAVAIPVTQIQNKAGKLVMAGVTQDMIEAMPEYVYADTPAPNNARREDFIAAADQDIAKGRAMLANLEKKAAGSATDTKEKLDLQITALLMDLKLAESKLDELKQATPAHWRTFEAGVSTAIARLRKSIEIAEH